MPTPDARYFTSQWNIGLIICIPRPRTNHSPPQESIQMHHWRDIHSLCGPSFIEITSGFATCSMDSLLLSL